MTSGESSLAREAGLWFRSRLRACHSLPAEAPALSLADVLPFPHPDPPRWSPDGAWLAWRWDDGGLAQLWVASAGGGEPARISDGRTSLTGFDWSKDGRLAFAQDQDLWLAEPAGAPRRLTRGGGPDREPRFSPAGDRLAFCRDGGLWVYDFSATCLTVLPLPGRVTPTSGDGQAFAWSPDGHRLAVSVTVGQQRDLAVVDLAGRLLWRTESPANENAFAWLDAERLHYTAVAEDCRRRVHRLVEPATGRERELVQEESAKGLKWELPALVRPGGAGLLYLLTLENWPQLHYLDLATGRLTRLADQPGDDSTCQGDFLGGSADGRWVVFSSNRGVELTQRRLWLVDLENLSWRPLTEGPGVDCCASFAPTGAWIAYLHCGPYESADIWVIRPDGGGARRVSRSMPAGVSPAKITRPTHLTFPSPDGLAVQADLFLPKGFDPEKRYPALIWVHGGMSRQMLYGWHPMRSYAVFYSFHQYLLHRGYLILSVDYRGSSGYGRDYEEANHLSLNVGDLADVIAGADFLKGLGVVKPEAIGIYGISYGGYLTLGALTKYPETFALGLNIAGVYDWAQWSRWRERQWVGAPWYGASTRLEGPENPANGAAWREASPRHFIDRMERPLLNLMGTADERVDYAQLEAIVSDCVRLGKSFAALSYPGETHMFTHRSTWADAFARIERAFDRYLKTPPEARPAAMI